MEEAQSSNSSTTSELSEGSADEAQSVASGDKASSTEGGRAARRNGKRPAGKAAAERGDEEQSAGAGRTDPQRGGANPKACCFARAQLRSGVRASTHSLAAT